MLMSTKMLMSGRNSKDEIQKPFVQNASSKCIFSISVLALWSFAPSLYSYILLISLFVPKGACFSHYCVYTRRLVVDALGTYCLRLLDSLQIRKKREIVQIRSCLLSLINTKMERKDYVNHFTDSFGISGLMSSVHAHKNARGSKSLQAVRTSLHSKIRCFSVKRLLRIHRKSECIAVFACSCMHGMLPPAAIQNKRCVY